MMCTGNERTKGKKRGTYRQAELVGTKRRQRKSKKQERGAPTAWGNMGGSGVMVEGNHHGAHIVGDRYKLGANFRHSAARLSEGRLTRGKECRGWE